MTPEKVLVTPEKVLVTLVKVLVTLVKVLVTLGKTKPGFLREHVNCTKVCLANGSCLDVKDLSEWISWDDIYMDNMGKISVWLPGCHLKS